MLYGSKIPLALLLVFIVRGMLVAQEQDSGKVVHTYSQRAKQVLFIARFKAGKDGARTLDLPQLLEAIVIEDQGGEAMFKVLGVDPTKSNLRGRRFQSPPLAILFGRSGFSATRETRRTYTALCACACIAGHARVGCCRARS